MDNQSALRIKDILAQSQRIAIAVGKNPNIDHMGAALALHLSLQSMGKSASVVSATEPIVEISNLVGIDKVKTKFEAEGSDLVVSFPYKEGEIEKVSYTIDNGYLNIVVKAGNQGLTFHEREVKYIRGGGGGQLDVLFSIGVGRLTDLQGMFDMDTLKDVTIVNIDNKQDNQGFGDVILVSPRFSSVSEQVTQLLADLNTEPDVDVAQNLLDGISHATENFQSPSTSYLAFEMASILMRQGAIRARLQPAPRRDFAPSQPAAQGSFGGNQNGQPQPRYNQSGQGQQQQPSQQPRRQPQQNQQERRQQFEERRQQFQERRAQQPSNQNQPQSQQPRFAPQAPQPAPAPINEVRTAPVAPQQVVQRPTPPVNTLPSNPSAQNNDDLNPPSDWLTPKVYKGSTNI